MIFRRKVYDKLVEWKDRYANSYSVLLEGPRRVGKSTVAEEFAKNEYETYIMIDFANTSDDVMSCFDDISDLDIFFLRLQAITGVNLVRGRSLIIFDEIQLFPKARQAIKYLVKDGRYHYIETGSLISIKKNIVNILIPSEEMKINVYPMDFEEFCWATGSNAYNMIREFYRLGKGLGQDLNRKFMREYRLYMAIGGMPQAVDAYISGKNFSEIDMVKRTIINLYEDDFKKIDPSGRISALYHSIPAQLSRDLKRYNISTATGKRKTGKDEEFLQELIESKTVLVSYNTSDPSVSMSLTKSMDSYKLYISDTGLFVTLMFFDRPQVVNEIYSKLLSDKLPANLGYLYENAVAQAIASKDHELYYHTWDQKASSHYYEIDFLVSNGYKLRPIEVKSSGLGSHKSLKEFDKKYSKVIDEQILLSQKDRCKKDGISFIPIYMVDSVM